MGSEKALLTCICIVLALFFVVMIVDYFVLLHMNVEFKFYCQRIFWKCEQEVGISSTERQEVIEELSRKGFNGIVVTAPDKGSVSKGEKIEFSIAASHEVSRWEGLFVKVTEQQKFLYERETISRRIVN